MKSVVYDKPRTVSTVIISIILAITLFVTFSVYPITWAAIKAAGDSASESSEGAGGAVAGVTAIVILGAFAVVVVFIAEIGAIIASLILLPFSIMNRKSTLQPVRIISYVLDGLIGVALIGAILKIVLMIAGV